MARTHSIRITTLTEREVTQLAKALEAEGFEYDEDYTTLYGSGWSITGVELYTANALGVAHKVLGTNH